MPKPEEDTAQTARDGAPPKDEDGGKEVGGKPDAAGRNRCPLPPWRQPRGKSQVNISQILTISHRYLLPPGGSI